MSDLHSDAFSQKGRKCHTVILTNFRKKEENVHWLFRLVFKKGGQCPLVTLTIIQKWEDFVLIAILTLFQTWEENSLEITMGELNPRKMNSQEF